MYDMFREGAVAEAAALFLLVPELNLPLNNRIDVLDSVICPFRGFTREY